VRELLESTVLKMNESEKVIKESQSGGQKAKAGKKGSSTKSDLEDAIYGLSSSVTLFMHLWRNIDCRGIVQGVTLLIKFSIQLILL